MATLRDEFAEHRDEPLPDAVQAAVRNLRDPAHADDVCLLAAHLKPI